MVLLNELRRLSRLAGKGEDSTHTSLFPELGSYYLESDRNTAQFMETYCDAIWNGEQVGICERLIGGFPILADIDLKQEAVTGAARLYTEEQLEKVVGIYMDLLEKVLPESEPRDRVCFVLEKKPYLLEAQSKMTVKHGFHLHFPYIFLRKEDHDLHIMATVQPLVNSVFERKDAFDSAVTTNGWLMYGSRKDGGKDPYLISKIFNHRCEQIPLSEAVQLPLLDDQGKEIAIQHPLEYYLPYVLSVNSRQRRVYNIAIDVMDAEFIQNYETSYDIDENGEVQDILTAEDDYSENLEKARLLLPLIHEDRANDYTTRMSIGWALHNSCGASKESLLLWIEFCERSGKNRRKDCVNRWRTMRKGGKGFGTIAHFAKLDNPSAFTRVMYDLKKTTILNSLDGTHYDLAGILYQDYGTVYVCASIVRKEWYEFNEHTWVKIEAGVALRNKISVHLVEYFREAMLREIRLARECEDDNARDKHNKRVEQCLRVIRNLKTASFKNSIMSECADRFYDETFEEKLDTNPYLIAFRNGIYDLKGNFFRSGLPSDYISRVVPYSYEEFDPTAPAVIEAQRFFCQIFPDSALREYFLDVMATIFVGNNTNKLLFVWSGVGDNGKSIMEEIFEKILGPYAIKMNTSLLTGKRTQSSQASPDLARLRGARLVFLQEPSASDKINVGVLKELSGNDSMYSRDLFQKGTEIREINPMFKLVLICNTPPAIPDADKAVWNRLRLIPFQSVFVSKEELPESEEERLLEKKFLKDPLFREKFPTLIPAIVWLLLERFRRNNGFIRSEPLAVLAATKAYRERNDAVQKFVNECIEESKEMENGKPCKLGLMEIHQSFKQWYQENIGEKTSISRDDLEEKLIKLMKKPDKKRNFIGYRFSLDEADD